MITLQEDNFAYVVLAVWDDSENGEWTTETALLGSFKTLEEAQVLVDDFVAGEQAEIGDVVTLTADDCSVFIRKIPVPPYLYNQRFTIGAYPKKD
ncbi:hypothetical protein [Ligilactobacillus apodemi]|uniref:Uncharacterized protein n=1 Tax=Ligilactobacillus apodemi DSM 16634 = JCM 16172 TaxID=1423724 RepID=A0A0R1TT56_9LACO|nr:hypothetical protein [Ligilactobacillus apodemi]KRL84078.1 hypothetical protein FC32_GL001355 [Ligilactobacillus apodemi DSM 16634 = JCM 16172]